MTQHENKKVALITGGARRIGAEIARQLHRAGYRIVIHHNRSAGEAAALCESLNQLRSESAVVAAGDLCDMNALRNLAHLAQRHWNRLDVLVNNASSFYPTPVGDISETDWDNLVGTNLKAPLFLSQALAPALKSTGGCIINLADVHAERPLSGHPVYCAAKAGNVMLTKSLAKELAPDVRVNGIAPGAILWPENDGELSESDKQNILQKIALKRIGSPADIARTVLFLVTEAPYVTGQIIAVDGGRNLVS
ncbi:pteridine reductase [Gilvimarinus sp. F26214L]|uniref:pteridine reductase n=1 Tax=Gilvimarinus sp. DZF01 TaxID=3461371 RepID=UPI0040463540